MDEHSEAPNCSVELEDLPPENGDDDCNDSVTITKEKHHRSSRRNQASSGSSDFSNGSLIPAGSIKKEKEDEGFPSTLGTVTAISPITPSPPAIPKGHMVTSMGKRFVLVQGDRAPTGSTTPTTLALRLNHPSSSYPSKISNFLATRTSNSTIVATVPPGRTVPTVDLVSTARLGVSGASNVRRIVMSAGKIPANMGTSAVTLIPVTLSPPVPLSVVQMGGAGMVSRVFPTQVNGIPASSVISITPDEGEGGEWGRVDGEDIENPSGRALKFTSRNLQSDGNVLTLTEYLCDLCQYKTADSEEYNTHYRTHIFTCNFCPNNHFFSRRLLLNHKKLCHTAESSFELAGYSGLDFPTPGRPGQRVMTRSSFEMVTPVINTSTVSVLKPVSATRSSSGVWNSARSAEKPRLESTAIENSRQEDSGIIVSNPRSEKPTLIAPRPENSCSTTADCLVISSSSSRTAPPTVVVSPSPQAITSRGLSMANVRWGCMYCKLVSTVQTDVVRHIMADHSGKAIQVKKLTIFSTPGASQDIQISTPVGPPIQKAISLLKNPPSEPPAGDTREQTLLRAVMSGLEGEAAKLRGGEEGKGGGGEMVVVWGCYYCNTQSQQRDDIISHIKLDHLGSKLTITRRRVTRSHLEKSADAGKDGESVGKSGDEAESADLCGDDKTDPVVASREQSDEEHESRSGVKRRCSVERSSSRTDKKNKMEEVRESRSRVKRTGSKTSVGSSGARSPSESSTVSCESEDWKGMKSEVSLGDWDVGRAERRARGGGRRSRGGRIAGEGGGGEEGVVIRSRRERKVVSRGRSPLISPVPVTKRRAGLRNSAGTCGDESEGNAGMDVVYRGDIVDTGMRDLTEIGSQCYVCGDLINNSDDIREHSEGHVDGLWRCTYCPYRSETRLGIERHVRVKHSTRAEVVIRRRLVTASCPSDDTGTSWFTSSDNNDTVMYSLLQFDCTDEHRSMGPLSQRRAWRAAMADTVWRCVYCSRCSVMRSDIVRHIKLVHPSCSAEEEGKKVREGVARWEKMEFVRGDRLGSVKAQVSLVRVEDKIKYVTHPSLAYESDTSDVELSACKKRFSCSACRFLAGTVRGIAEHMRLKHAGREIIVKDFREMGTGLLYVCGVCNYVTDKQSLLHEHVKRSGHTVHGDVLQGDGSTVEQGENSIGSGNTDLDKLCDCGIDNENNSGVDKSLSNQEDKSDMLSKNNSEAKNESCLSKVDNISSEGVVDKVVNENMSSKDNAIDNLSKASDILSKTLDNLSKASNNLSNTPDNTVSSCNITSDKDLKNSVTDKASPESLNDLSVCSGDGTTSKTLRNSSEANNIESNNSPIAVVCKVSLSKTIEDTVKKLTKSYQSSPKRETRVEGAENEKCGARGVSDIKCMSDVPRLVGQSKLEGAENQGKGGEDASQQNADKLAVPQVLLEDSGAKSQSRGLVNESGANLKSNASPGKLMPLKESSQSEEILENQKVNDSGKEQDHVTRASSVETQRNSEVTDSTDAAPARDESEASKEVAQNGCSEVRQDGEPARRVSVRSQGRYQNYRMSLFDTYYDKFDTKQTKQPRAKKIKGKKEEVESKVSEEEPKEESLAKEEVSLKSGKVKKRGAKGLKVKPAQKRGIRSGLSKNKIKKKELLGGAVSQDVSESLGEMKEDESLRRGGSEVEEDAGNVADVSMNLSETGEGVEVKASESGTVDKIVLKRVIKKKRGGSKRPSSETWSQELVPSVMSLASSLAEDADGDVTDKPKRKKKPRKPVLLDGEKDADEMEGLIERKNRRKNNKVKVTEFSNTELNSKEGEGTLVEPLVGLEQSSSKSIAQQDDTEPNMAADKDQSLSAVDDPVHKSQSENVDQNASHKDNIQQSTASTANLALGADLRLASGAVLDQSTAQRDNLGISLAPGANLDQNLAHGADLDHSMAPECDSSGLLSSPEMRRADEVHDTDQYASSSCPDTSLCGVGVSGDIERGVTSSAPVFSVASFNKTLSDSGGGDRKKGGGRGGRGKQRGGGASSCQSSSSSSVIGWSGSGDGNGDVRFVPTSSSSSSSLLDEKKYTVDGKPAKRPRRKDLSLAYPQRYECTHCEYKVGRLDGIKEHVLIQHAECLPAVCIDRRARELRKRQKILFCAELQCSFYCKQEEELERHECGECPFSSRPHCPLAFPATHPPSTQSLDNSSYGDGRYDVGCYDNSHYDNSGGVADDRMFQCSHCSYISTNLLNMRMHVAGEHSANDGGFTEVKTAFGLDGNVVMNVNDHCGGPDGGGGDLVGMVGCEGGVSEVMGGYNPPVVRMLEGGGEDDEKVYTML